jgi:hypothetical protein
MVGGAARQGPGAPRCRGRQQRVAPAVEKPWEEQLGLGFLGLQALVFRIELHQGVQVNVLAEAAVGEPDQPGCEQRLDVPEGGVRIGLAGCGHAATGRHRIDGTRHAALLVLPAAPAGTGVISLSEHQRGLP